MKPHIHKVSGFWRCEGSVGHFKVCAEGFSFVDAFRRYATRMHDLMNGKVT